MEARPCRVRSSTRGVGEPLERVEVLEPQALRARLDEAAGLEPGELAGELVDAQVEIAGDDAAFQRVGDQRRVAALVGVVARQRDEQRRDAPRRGSGARVRASDSVRQRHLALDRRREARARPRRPLGGGIDAVRGRQESDVSMLACAPVTWVSR